jgi:parvulin-like peptidyl-prolyl isomerase
MILKIWESSPPYKLKGQFWDISVEKTMIPEIGQGFVMKPYQQPHPPIVGTAVAPFSQGVTEMAKRGWGPISANFLMPEWVKSHWPKYVEGRTAVGALASPSEWRIAKSIFVCDDEKTAQQVLDKIKRGAKFDAVALESSRDPNTRDKGGLSEWVAEGQLTPAILQAVQSLKTGQMAPQAVQTPVGWQVLRLEDKRAVKAPSLESVTPRLKMAIAQKKVQAQLAALRASAKVE